MVKMVHLLLCILDRNKIYIYIYIYHYRIINWASLVAQLVKSLPTMWETWFQSLGWEDPLEKEMETHSSILAWRIPWTEKPGGLSNPWGCKESDTTEWLTHTRAHAHTHKIIKYLGIKLMKDGGFPKGPLVKNSPCNAGHTSSIPRGN